MVDYIVVSILSALTIMALYLAALALHDRIYSNKGNIPLLLQMRKQGVRLDMPQLKKTAMLVTEKHFELQEAIYDYAGKEFDINSSAQLAKVFDKLEIEYPRNEPTELMKAAGKSGNPNLDKDSLPKLKDKHPIVKAVLDFRHYNRLTN